MRGLLIIMKREWLSYRKSVVSRVVSLVLLPLILFMALGLPMYKLIKDVQQLNYLHWVGPGIWVSTAFFMAYITAFTGTFRIRNSRGVQSVLLKAPVSVWSWLAGITLSGIILGVIQLLISLFLIGMINKEVFSPAKWGGIFLMILPIVCFGAVLGNLFGSWIRNYFTAFFWNFLLMIIFLFGTGVFIPLDYFPESLREMIHSIPVVGNILAVQLIVLFAEFSLRDAIITAVLSAVIFIINGAATNKFIRK